ncbi:MAG: LCP family protein [bacterium]|nr:LCP family protein [Acidimicrobiia bacterium]MCY4651470.1 LCP family protein [bacterium]
MTVPDLATLKRHQRRRRVWIGILGLLLVLATLVSWVFETFKEDERYSPLDARETMASQPAGEVELSRAEFDERDRPSSTIRPLLPVGDDSPQIRLEAASASGNGPSGASAEFANGEGVAGPSSASSSRDAAGDSETALSPSVSHPPEHLNGASDSTYGAGKPALEEEEAEPYSNPYVTSPSLPDEMFDSVLLIGADAGGKLADAIILGLFPQDGSPPALVSIPRDLYLPNPCTKDYRRVNANLWGCRGGVSGPELLSVVVEDFTGVAVDHYVRIEFSGFVELVDGLGGVEVCLEHPTVDENAMLDVAEGGCFMADGETALAYARSRNARQLVDGEWQRAWSSDTVRQSHQREILLEMAGKLREFSLTDLISSFQALSHTFGLDSEWSVADAVGWAWRYHDLDLSQVTQLRVAVDDHETPFGELVAVPTRLFNSVLSQWWGAAAR